MQPLALLARDRQPLGDGFLVEDERVVAADVSTGQRAFGAEIA